MLKLGTAKVRLESYSVQKAKIMYDWNFRLLEMLSKLLLGFYSIGYAKIKYGWGFKLLEMLKEGTTWVLFHRKC